MTGAQETDLGKVTNLVSALHGLGPLTDTHGTCELVVGLGVTGVILRTTQTPSVPLDPYYVQTATNHLSQPFDHSPHHTHTGLRPLAPPSDRIC